MKIGDLVKANEKKSGINKNGQKLSVTKSMNELYYI